MVNLLRGVIRAMIFFQFIRTNSTRRRVVNGRHRNILTS